MCILKTNQYNHKDTESTVGDADLAHVQCSRYSMQMVICPSMEYHEPPETMLGMTYVQRWCTQICTASTTPSALLRGLNATCHICAHIGEPETTVQYTCSQEEQHPPERIYVRHSVILSEEVTLSVKRHYHNGGQSAAKHRS